MNKRNTSQKKNKGLSLVEMVVVITIIGLLTAIALPNFLPSTSKVKKNTKISRTHLDISTIVIAFK